MTDPATDRSSQAEYRIGEINILPGDLFDKNIPEQQRFIHRITNRLHIKTRNKTIKAALTIRAGDIYSPDKLAEAERALRAKRYLRDASVKAVSFCHSSVLVEVRTVDNWTLTPSISYGRAGGVNTYDFVVQDFNVFGTGKELKLKERRTDKIRESSFTYGDDNVFGSRHRLRLDFGENHNGTLYELQAGVPFFSNESLYSWWLKSHSETFSFQSTDQPDQAITVLSELTDIRIDRRFKYSQNRSFTLGAGLRHEKLTSSSSNESAYLRRTSDFSESYPYFEVRMSQPHWIKRKNYESIHVNEDISLGYSFGTEAGFLFKGIGENYGNGLRLRTNIQNGWQWRSSAFHRAAIQHTHYLNSDQQKQASSASYEYFRWINDNDQLHIRFSAERFTGFSPIHNRLIGGENGLKAYPNEYQQGQNRAIGLLEYRHVTGWSPYSLLNTGFSVFLESGSAWSSGDPARPLANIGAGLLLAPTRSSIAALNRIEVAVPLVNGENVGRFQIFVGTRVNY